MSEDRNLAVEVAAVLDEFAASQRALAIGEEKKQRIILRRNVGPSAEVTLETVLPQGASAEEIFAAMDPVNSAIDRLANKVELARHYEAMLNKCGEIELSIKQFATDRVAFAAANAERNASRRVPRVMTEQQRAKLAAHRESISANFERIAEIRRAADECRRIIGGADPFDVLAGQIEERLKKLRGAVPDSVAAA